MVLQLDIRWVQLLQPYKIHLNPPPIADKRLTEDHFEADEVVERRIVVVEFIGAVTITKLLVRDMWPMRKLIIIRVAMYVFH